MAPRPGRVVDDIQIELEYPRNRNSKKFLQYRTKIMEMLDFGKSETEAESEVC
jgi:NitT/TauT family transport system ATP-binding protein